LDSGGSVETVCLMEEKMMVNITYIRTNNIKVPKGQRILRNIENIAESIHEIGIINPITVDKDKTLINGYHRLEAYCVFR